MGAKLSRAGPRSASKSVSTSGSKPASKSNSKSGSKPASKSASRPPSKTGKGSRPGPASSASSGDAGAAGLSGTPGTPVTIDAAEPSYTIVIRYRVNGDVTALRLVTDDRAFYPFVQRWRYVVANRRRITRRSRESLSRDMSAWMASVCEQEAAASFDAHVKAIARADLIEVAIPYRQEFIGWAARLFPWENALALLTRPLRDESARFLVVRHLQTPPEPFVGPRQAAALVVRSGPGEIGRIYDLDRECAMVRDTLSPGLGGRVRRLDEPDRSQLTETLRTVSPAIVHVAAVDPWALEARGLGKADPENTDGVVLRGGGTDGAGLGSVAFDSVTPEHLSVILTGGSPKPLLVAVTSCFSALRVAALSVARGARYAIGFVDTLTDADAMLFFGCFYRAWARDRQVLKAFDEAQAEWASQSPAESTGVVLWSRVSLLDDPAPADESATVAAGETTAEAAVTTAVIERPATVADLRLHVSLIEDRAPTGTRSPGTSLNYSLLHNDRTPFKTFFVEKPLPGRLPHLQVEVALEVGDELCRCRFSEELPAGTASIELAPRIRLPLVAGLLRHCTESLRTNLYIRASCGDRLLRESSERVTVLPADEWRDDGEDHRWLPSFVLPRDPAVLKVIDAAQRYLRTLLDDCAAGFDGYQRLATDDANAADVVDAQVQAIWAALQHDLPVNYINPPPSYTSQSQRLRSPSEIFRGRAATCIDLALLFASCLEFVGIYPVVFLVTGHAFPGYWRSDKAWWRMKQFQFGEAEGTGLSPLAAAPGAAAEPDPSRLAMTGGQSEGWMFDGVENLVELLRYVQEGALVPFESTFVCAQRGFFPSLEQGAARLHPDTFDAMIDVQSARGANVTPLPVFDRFS